MKKICYLLLSFVMFVSLTACEKNSAEQWFDENEITEEEYNVYLPVLESWSEAIQENFGYNHESQEGAIYPFICQSIPSEMYDAHYAYYDIDDDGVKELFISSFYNNEYSFIIDVYSIYQDNPIRLFEGLEDLAFWSRNNLNFSKDGMYLIVQSSGGAAYTTNDFSKFQRMDIRLPLLRA